MRLTHRPIHPFKLSVLLALLTGLLLVAGCNRESPDDRFARLIVRVVDDFDAAQQRLSDMRRSFVGR